MLAVRVRNKEGLDGDYCYRCFEDACVCDEKAYNGVANEFNMTYYAENLQIE